MTIPRTKPSCKKGVNAGLVRHISRVKKEPTWMMQKRLQGLAAFKKSKDLSFGPDLSGLDIDAIRCYTDPGTRTQTTWEKLPADIRRTFDRLGIPKVEREYLGGIGAQYDSESVYHTLREELAKEGVVFEDTDTALRKYPELVRRILYA